MNKIQVVGLGALNIDRVYEVERLVTDGEAVIIKSASYPGGSAANTIYGLARLGVKTGFIGAVGDDNEGRMMVENFQKTGVDTGQIKVIYGVPTGSALCLSDRQGQRSLYVSPGANSRLSPGDVAADYINQADRLHISSFVADNQLQMLHGLMSRLDCGVRVSFSPGTLYAAKGLTALAPILARTQVIFLNRDEIRQLTGQDIRDGAETCARHGCHTIVVTLGKGTTIEIRIGQKARAVAYIRDGGNEYAVDSPHTTTPIDTTGVGDAFAAGFLYGLWNNRPIIDCGRLGDIAAKFCLEKSGAREGLPAHEALSRRYQQLYNNPL